jgi:hypothetical protein
MGKAIPERERIFYQLDEGVMEGSRERYGRKVAEDC